MNPVQPWESPEICARMLCELFEPYYYAIGCVLGPAKRPSQAILTFYRIVPNGGFNGFGEVSWWGQTFHKSKKPVQTCCTNTLVWF